MTDYNAVLAEIKGAVPFVSEADAQNAFKIVFFGSEDGRRVLAGIIEACWYHKPLFDPGTDVKPADPFLLATRAGMRLAAIEILNVLGKDPTEEAKIETDEKDIRDA